MCVGAQLTSHVYPQSGPRLRLSCDVASKQKSTTYDLSLWGGYMETMVMGGRLSLGTGVDRST